MSKPIVWTIAGSDSGGGAGIQADLHTFHALGAYGCSVITAITAQNSVAVKKVSFVDAEDVGEQIQALATDLPAKAIKLGMPGNPDAISTIRDFLKDYHHLGKIVLDPVMVAGSGDTLFSENVETYVNLLRTYFPYIELITPNIPEAEALTGITISAYEDMQKAADILISQGVKNVLIKGGHLKNKGELFSQDYWTDGTHSFWLSSLRDHQLNIHGTGCTLSSAIAACLALGHEIKDAIVLAKMYVTQGIRHAEKYGKGLPPVQHSGFPHDSKDLPFLSPVPRHMIPDPFPTCGDDLGIYPIVDGVKWLELLLPAGVKTIQLRIKDKIDEELEDEIRSAINIAQHYSARLFINDYWELAIKYRAYGVHLGQEDIATADIKKIKQAGLRLGLSTHNYEELATAHTLNPSYIAFGPIFPTTSKAMIFGPRGIEMLKKIRRLVDYPLVAIGGITSENISDVAKIGVNGIAMISAITQAKNPSKMLRIFTAYYEGRKL